MRAGEASRAQGALSWFLLLFVTCGWALTFAVTKSAFAHASPGAFLVARFGVGALAAGLLAGRDLFHRPSLRAGALLGLFLWLGFALNTWGLFHTTATRAGFVTSLYVVLVPILGAWLFGLRASRAAFAGAALAAMGPAVMSGPAALGEGGPGPGDLLIVGSAIAYAFQVLLTGRYAPQVRPGPTVAAQLAVGAVLSLLLLPFEEIRFEPTPGLLASVAYTGVFASAVFLFIQTWAQVRTSATRAAVVFSLEPLVAAGFAWMLLDDPLEAPVWAGGCLIVAGIALAELWPVRGADRLA